LAGSKEGPWCCRCHLTLMLIRTLFSFPVADPDFANLGLLRNDGSGVTSA